MKAMLLAAGRGKRMRLLTKRIPKPLLSVGSATLIEHNLQQLRDAGVDEVVINVHYFADQIVQKIGDGQRFGLQIHYSIESDKLLGTGGGIQAALNILGDAPFLVMSSDVWTEYPLQQLLQKKDVPAAHVVLVKNPDYHRRGDFALQGDRTINRGDPKLTYGNIAVLNPSIFFDKKSGSYPLSEILFTEMDKGTLTGEHYDGVWYNVGTPRELRRLQHYLNRLSV